MAMLASQAGANTNRWRWHSFQSAVSRFVQELVFVHKKETWLPLPKRHRVIWVRYLHIRVVSKQNILQLGNNELKIVHRTSTDRAPPQMFSF